MGSDSQLIWRTGCRRAAVRAKTALSIVEVLCAIALLSFLLMPVFQFVLNASTDAKRSELHLRALCLAQQKLEEALLLGPAGAATLPESQVDRFRVKVGVVPYQGNQDLHDYWVTVSWSGDRGAGRKEVQLRTLQCELSL